MSSLNASQGRHYWRSLDELAQTPEFRAFVESEFPNRAGEMLSGASRRQFLKIMGASFALAGLTGCRRWPEEKLAPFTHRPEGRTPGTAQQFATAMDIGGVATGLLVTSHDGRPIKVEGNPLHPASLGAASAMAQASVLDLYDPDRSRCPIQRTDTSRQDGTTRSWDDFAKFARQHFDALKSTAGAGLAVLSEASSSLSVAEAKKRWQKAFPQARWYEYEPISRDNEREGMRLAFSKPLRPQLHLDKADIIVSLGADLLGIHPNALRYARDWVAGRRAESVRARSRPWARLAVASVSEGTSATMNRMYVAESTYTITGSVADHRLPVRPSEMFALLDQLRRDIHETCNEPFVRNARTDLNAHRGRSVVAVGPGQPPELHVLAAQLNAELGNVGTTIAYTEELDADRPTHIAAIQALVADMRAGNVKTLLILGGNPVYDAPADLGFADAMTRVGTAIHLGLHENETSLRCQWHVPRAHYLEAWGDARAWDGTISIVQPLIQPLYGGKSDIELLAMLLGETETNGYDIVRRTFASFFTAADFEASWRRALHDGLIADSAFKTAEAKPQAVGNQASVPESSSSFEIAFVPDRKVYDGRFANNGWLQELPDTLTQITWDNAALISVADAGKLGIKTNDVIAISANGRQIEIAAYVMPGQAQGSIALPLGYGRSAAGRVGDGVGFNTYTLRTTQAMSTIASAAVSKTAKFYKLACAQDHHGIDRIGYEERKHRAAELIREVSLPVYRQNPHAVAEMGPKANGSQLWEPPLPFNQHRWGMTVDLTSCIGCNACVVACQAENNIPIVGKQEVNVGREMHWIRIDRYFSGEPTDPAPRVAYQPMACHHCENAPCESVCPVTATVHDTEGLNTMVYNRCIGARYCSNNCPYKVRRFNYFDYHSKGPKDSRRPWLGMPDTQQVQEIDLVRRMGFNPDVTVRMRGVMEKCTYCVQRIQQAKIRANNEKRPLADGEITPACAQTCPTQTIVFGDLNDPNSRVRKLQEDNRSYFILEELNLRARTKYLARITNTNDEVPNA
jgi:molybdopterin-containing oxidoreductase family iron-sulfur binding subunit